MKHHPYTLTVLAVWIISHAAQAGTITIGGQTKDTSGTIVNVTQGDVACYLTLKNDAPGLRALRTGVPAFRTWPAGEASPRR